MSQGRDNDSWEEMNWESWQCSGAGADAVDVLDVNTLFYFIFSTGGGLVISTLDFLAGSSGFYS